MAEGTNVGSIFLDLIVRDTVEKQVQSIAAKSQATAQKAFSGMEKAAEGSVNKTVSKSQKLVSGLMKVCDTLSNGPARAMEKALTGITRKTQKSFKAVETSAAVSGCRIAKTMSQSVGKLEKEIEEINRSINILNSYGFTETNSKEVSALVDSRNKLYDRLAKIRDRYSSQSQIAAEKESAAERAAIQKTIAAEEKAASRRKSIHASMWKNMLAKAGNGLKAIFGKADKSASRFGTRLKGIVSSALVFNILSAGLRNVTSYLGKSITATDEMKSALANLKGAAANAASPIIQVLTPALVALANVAATVFSYVSRLLTMLTGKISNAASTAQKSAGGAAGAAKKAAKSLASFDEINALNGNSEDSDGSGAGSEAKQFNYDFQGKSPFLDSVLAAINAGQWEQVGALFAEKLNSAVSSISWPDIQERAKQWAQNLASTINGFVTNVDWGLMAGGISSGFKTALDSVTAFLLKLNWKGIGKGIKAFIDKTDWGGISKALFKGIGAALGGIGALIWAVIEDEWNAMVDTWLENTERCGGDIVAGLLLSIVQGLANIGKWIVDNIFKPFIDGFKKAFDIHSPSGVMEEQGTFLVLGLLNGLKNAWSKVTSYVSDMLRKLKSTFSDAFRSVQKVVTSIWKDGIVPAIKGAVNGIIAVVNGMISGIAGGINAVIRTLNKLSVKLPDWDGLGSMAGKTFGFNIGYVSAPKIPYLADGGVITQPTLAMMGEYSGARNNPEIVAPQSIIAETVADVLESANEGKTEALKKIIEILMDIDRLLQLIFRNGGINITVSGDLAALVRLLKPYIDKENRRVGGSLVKGG